MGNPYPAEIIDANGNVTAGSFVTFTDSGNQPGGGSQPTTREQLSGNATACPYQTPTALTWDTKSFGTALLDISSPAAPTIVTTGTYAITVTVAGAGGMTSGTNYTVNFDVDLSGEDASCYQDSAAATALQAAPAVSLTLVYYLVAGSVLRVNVTSQDVAAPAFALSSAMVQRLS